ncbi:MAG: hypothetical protein WA681_14360 [Candidatus Acidiferrales bacterium]
MKNNAIWWVLGILGGLLVILVMGGIVLGAYLVRMTHVRENAEQMEISTPLGKVDVEKNGTHSTGLPAYPGASLSPYTRGGSVQFSAGDDASFSFATEKYITPDSVDKVREWYRSHLGADFRQQEPGSEDSVEWNGRKYPIEFGQTDVAFLNDSRDAVRLVALKNLFGKTEIDLLRIGPRQVQ